MNYTELTPDHCQTLRRERILALESEHFRTRLKVAELRGDDPTELYAHMTDLERRISAHAVAATYEGAASDPESAG